MKERLNNKKIPQVVIFFYFVQLYNCDFQCLVNVHKQQPQLCQPFLPWFVPIKKMYKIQQ